MGVSFQEKSLWILFVSVAVAFAFYFTKVLPASTVNVSPTHVGLFIGATVLLIVVQIIGHILAAIVDRRFETDERDEQFELRAIRTSTYVLQTGVFLALCASLVTEGNFIVTHVLLAFWVLAQLVETGYQLYLHRRGG